MANEKKLSLKKETLRELDTAQVDALDQIVGGTCGCTSPVARTAPPPCQYTCDTTYVY